MGPFERCALEMGVERLTRHNDSVKITDTEQVTRGSTIPSLLRINQTTYSSPLSTIELY